MSAKDLVSHIGKKYNFNLPNTAVYFEVQVIDARISFGTLQYLITPVSGKGETWVNA